MPDLFGEDVPPGMFYRDAFISEQEERELLTAIADVAFDEFTMRGVVARRRVAFFGASYDRSTATRPMPAFLLPLRAKLAAWARVPADAFAMALINEYPAGAPIGWHRDAPQYDIVGGVSLRSACRMKLRPYLSPKAAASAATKRVATHEIVLGQRSAYLMTGESRNGFEHHIPPVEHPRYSVTFRTLRG